MKKIGYIKKFFSKTLLLITAFSFFVPIYVSAESLNQDKEKIFKARVEKVVEEKEKTREDGSRFYQQNLILRGLEGEFKNAEIIYTGISEFDDVSAGRFDDGDKILVNEIIGQQGEKRYYIVDFVRSSYLFWLAAIFAVIIILIGKKKGLKSLLSLLVSFAVIVWYIIPKILSGSSPVVIGVSGALAILVFMIYMTEGFTKKSHIAVLSVFISLLVTFLLSVIFTGLTKLTGLVQEEAIFLIGLKNVAFDFRGLLLAGILIGTVGVLDDVIVGQIEAVRQIRKANPGLKNMEVFKSAYEVGNSHLGAIVNTLFLTYAGASLPLLLLFNADVSGTITFSQVINNELVATEIVRTLVGSIGVALSVPVSTLLSAVWLKE